MTLELRKFNMRDITFKPNENKGPVIVMIGRRDTGKSLFSERFIILSSRYSYWNCYFWNRSRKWFLCVNMCLNLFIHEEYNTALIENILRRQKTVLKQMKKEIENIKRSNIDPRHLLY